MSIIPKGTQKAADEADRILLEHEARLNGKEPEKVEEIVKVEPVVVKPVETPVEPTAVKPVVVEPTVVKPLTPKVEKTPSNDEGRIKVLEDKLANEVHKRSIDQGRHDKDLKEQTDQVAARDEIIAELSTKDRADSIKEAFSEEERETLGEPYIDGITKAVNIALAQERAVTSVKIDGITNALKELREGTAEDSNIAYNDQVFTKLGMSRAEMQEIDQSQEFDTFCKQPDGFSGLTVGQSLDNAVVSKNVTATTGIYEAFKASRGLGASTPPAVFPDRSATTTSVLETETNNAPMTHEEIAIAYGKNEISHSKMEELNALADAYIEKMFQDGR